MGASDETPEAAAPGACQGGRQAVQRAVPRSTWSPVDIPCPACAQTARRCRVARTRGRGRLRLRRTVLTRVDPRPRQLVLDSAAPAGEDVFEVRAPVARDQDEEP